VLRSLLFPSGPRPFFPYICPQKVGFAFSVRFSLAIRCFFPPCFFFFFGPLGGVLGGEKPEFPFLEKRSHSLPPIRVDRVDHAWCERPAPPQDTIIKLFSRVRAGGITSPGQQTNQHHRLSFVSFVWCFQVEVSAGTLSRFFEEASPLISGLGVFFACN